MLPQFIIAGIQKSGTTYVDSLLREHDDIFMPDRTTDYSFFDNQEIYQKGIAWYEALFPIEEKSKTLGQTSVDCAFDPESLDRIKKHIPDAKLIFVIREPISRAYSHFWHQIKMGRENKSFEKALAYEKKRTQQSYFKKKKFSYLGRSQYSQAIYKAEEMFGKENVLSIPFELFIKNELTFLNVIFKFLGVSEIEELAQVQKGAKRTNPSKIPRNKLLLWLSPILNSNKLTHQLYMKLLVTQKTPDINKQTKKELEILLKKEIAFYQSMKQNWLDKLANGK